MSEVGLRAWIGDVERRLGARTRVMLALAAIALGGAGAAIYLAVDAHDTAVGEADLKALQRRLEARIDQVSGTAGGGVAMARLEAEVRVLKGEVEALKGGAAKPGSGAAAEGPANQGPAERGAGAESPRAEGPAGRGAGGTAGGAEGSSGAGTTRKAAPPPSNATSGK